MKLNERAEIIRGKKEVYTELVIAAHQDDVEIMCPQGIVSGYQNEDNGLVAVICTDGAGSPRAGLYADMTDEQMKVVRRTEQIEAAEIGEYADLILLNYTSREIKDKSLLSPTDDIAEIILRYKPQIMYVHNLADKHPTHVASAVRCIEALRSLPRESRPSKLYGCEVWRGLDWLSDDEKVVFDLTGYNALLSAVLDVHKSQIAGGKEYCAASMGRRAANATYSASHGVDKYTHCAYAMELTPLIEEDGLDVREFIVSKLKKFENELLV